PADDRGLRVQALCHGALEALGRRVDGHPRSRLTAAGPHRRRAHGGPGRVDLPLHRDRHHRRRHLRGPEEHHRPPQARPPQELLMLEGITVLDLSTVGPAARASRWLADYGARVVKVGAPAGLQIEPPFYAYSAHRGMDRVGIDLKSADGLEQFMALVDSADVLIESFRPGVVDRLSIGYDALKGRNPRLVYCSTSGYGQDGPRAQWAGHDLNYLAVGGFLDCSGRGPDMRPPIPGATVADSAGGGMHAVIAVLAALVHRGSTGEGAHLDVSVADGVLALMALAGDEYLAAGTVPGPGA